MLPDAVDKPLSWQIAQFCGSIKIMRIDLKEEKERPYIYMYVTDLSVNSIL